FGLESGKDPWTELHELCESFGWRLWLDRSGSVQLDQASAQADTRELLVLQPSVAMSSRPYNVVVGRWTPTDGSKPICAIAVDDDPASPTFVGGPYGRVTYYFASTLPITQGGANQAVEALLQSFRYQGAGRTWEVPYDPTIDPDDVVSASNLEWLPNTVVESMTVNLTGTTRLELSELPS